ncbi:MAG: elongation factor G [candidate division WOR-3 bacterium]|nr:elongation factor G [candidate division WOR-3 bacterium]MDW8150283.1 elongation factor G [candidate division WOR-3 bacterium]
MNDRTFVIAGHVGSGKTTLLSQILKITNALAKADKNLIDYDPIEQTKNMTINLKVLRTKYKNYEFQFIDTPGFIEFEGELISGTRVADNMLIVVDISMGLEVGIERAFEEAKKHNLPIFFAINKCKSYEKHPEEILNLLKNKFGKQVHPVQVPIGIGQNFIGVFDIVEGNYETLDENLRKHAIDEYNEFIEAVVETDDDLLEKYMEGKEITKQELHDAFRKAIDSSLFYPVLYIDALNNIGMVELLDFLGEYGISYSERFESKPHTSILIFKTYSEAHIGETYLFRVLSGKLKAGMELRNMRNDTIEKISHLYVPSGKEKKEVNELSMGEIGLILKLKDSKTGDTLSNGNERYEWVEYPEPLYVIGIKPKSKKDEEKLSESLQKIMSEDPTFTFKYEPQLKQTLLYSQGEVHVNIILEKLKQRFNVEVEKERAKVPYKETIRKQAEGLGKYIKQTGGRGQYGVVNIKIEPLQRGQGYEWIDKIFGGAIPKEYRPYVEQGVKKAMEEGAVLGYPIIDIKVTLFDGKYHEVDSSNLAFEIAGSLALKDAVSKAEPFVLEPIYNVEIYSPEEYISDVISEVNTRRGKILGIETNKIISQIPLAELYDFLPALRAKTKGRGRFKMEFSHYQEVSINLVKQ